MYRDGKQLVTSSIHNFVLNQGALGDVLCSLPAIIQARRTYPILPKMRVWLRIQNHLNLSPQELWRLTSGED